MQSISGNADVQNTGAAGEKLDEIEDVDEEIDAEIIEIFVEEAGEVQEAIAEFLPSWEAGFKDQEALIEIRRAFHTLKGSGRIVRAMDVGELSWSIENMLNRILDKTLTPTQIQMDLIRKVLELLPSMVDAFSRGQSIADKAHCEQYQAWAHELVKNEAPEDLIAYLAKDNPPQAEEIDAELWEIFGSEAEAHLAVIREYILSMEAKSPFFECPDDAMQRAVHTLKGSAHMAEITPVALLMTPMELFVKDLRAYQVSIDDDILQLIKDSVSYTEGALEQVSRLVYPKIEKLELFLARVAELRERSVGHLIKHEEDTGPKVDPAFLEKLMSEGMSLLLDIDGVIDGWKETPANDQQWRAVANEVANVQHGAQRANLDSMVHLSEEIYKQYESLIAKSLLADDHLYDILLDAHYALLDIIDAIAGGQDLPPANEEILKKLRDLSETNAVSVSVEAENVDESRNEEPAALNERSSQDVQASHEAVNDLSVGVEPHSDDVTHQHDLNSQSAFAELASDNSAANHNVFPDDVDGEIVEIFMEEAAELIDDLDATIDGWESGEDAILSNEGLQRLLHTFKGGARLAGFMALGDLAHNFESYLVAQSKGDLSADILSAVHRYQDQLIHGVNTLGRTTVMPVGASEINRSTSGHDGAFDKGSVESSEGNIGQESDEEQGVNTEFNNSDINSDVREQAKSLESQPEHQPEHQNESHESSASVNDEYLQIKDDEQSGLGSANDQPDQPDQRLGDNVEKMSSSNDDTPPTLNHEDAVVDLPATPLYNKENNIVSFPASPIKADAPELSPPSTPAPFNKGSDVSRASDSVNNSANSSVNSTAAAHRPAPQETVKVSAELMEELVNLAGETSISRGRMEEQMSDLGYSLEEMEQTVGRLDEQLRRLDIETEAQVVFRQEQLGEEEDFDPLEMDRYSQLQQLSRSLVESASDLKDLKHTLVNKTRDAETVLLQQSRINTELQEGLMRSRMVPFSRIVPRLRRIVRQISAELGKEVAIEFNQTEGELDRNMMERMVAPLEHMLRNAVDHGIESTDTRKQLGKSAAGRISLSLSREGGNVLLLLSDDGAGMSVDKIREKAIQQELMNSDAELSDKEILQFIFQAGFSTAESVTQISGRGVGMDVVSSEIKQLGGSVDISSVEGQGSQFSIRLPFTVSVNRALMISMGDDRYAIPLNSIEGIARIAPDELANYYTDPDSRFHYAGTDYQLQYMGTLLNKDVAPRLKGHQLPVPVLLVRSADHSVAIQVDSLSGSQEIVVKTLGAQFSSVQGLSGATIMGDGHVVIILDTNSMLRQQFALSAIHQSPNLEEKIEQPLGNRNPIVMVVDDSVTVRKVTTRFLEREGFDVITAKDGVHAIEILRDQTPDIILLDIEMPRMDGFEVARRVRANPNIKHLPIIMITSRTGEKHRQTGLAAGANEYMGKPFQEDVLLDNIQQLLHIDR
ncbi:MAG: chemosensory pili system protein ChpA (sensor histidine kinase/response regulator) [Granulosicoccus sp.]|jgi:chemosensory pili system protein ChpA (sensor histidine kinase/response regulator)